MAGIVDIPAIVREENEEDNEAITLEENVIREDVNSMDIARYLLYFIQEKGYTITQLAEKFNKSTNWVNLMLRLLNLNPQLQAGVEAGQIPYASALELDKVEDPDHKRQLTEAAIEGGASHRTIRNWVLSYHQEKDVQRRIESGEYVEPPTHPYHPLKFTCFLCGNLHENNEMITVRVGSECYMILKDLVKIAHREGLVVGPTEQAQASNTDS